MPRFVELLSVKEQGTRDVYVARIVADIEDNGVHEEVDYGVVPGDHIGIASVVRAAVIEWLNYGKPVTPWVPPTVEQLRAQMADLSRRQLLLALASIGITEQTVADTITDNLDLIEWNNATSFERLNPLLTDVADSLGLPAEQVDDLWNWALSL